MRGSWNSKGSGADSAVDSKGTEAASGVDSDAVVRFAEMAVGIAMGLRVLKNHRDRLINDRCCVYLESTSVV
jgi:hypothetical protein